jgi:hypothetical protein
MFLKVRLFTLVKVRFGWKGGGTIAVNYEARAVEVTR